MPTRDVELQRVNPGDEIKAAAQNLVIEAIEKRPTDGQSIFMGGEYNEMDW